MDTKMESENESRNNCSSLSETEILKNQTNHNQTRKRRLWYCCPFCQAVQFVQENRKNLRVFATQIGLISHVKLCHPDKQAEKINVLQLQQCNIISNHLQKTCFTKSIAKLELTVPEPTSVHVNVKVSPVTTPALVTLTPFQVTPTPCCLPTTTMTATDAELTCTGSKINNSVTPTILTATRKYESVNVNPLESPNSSKINLIQNVRRNDRFPFSLMDVSVNGGSNSDDCTVTLTDKNENNAVSNIKADTEVQKPVELIDLTVESETESGTDTECETGTETELKIKSNVVNYSTPIHIKNYKILPSLKRPRQRPVPVEAKRKQHPCQQKTLPLLQIGGMRNSVSTKYRKTKATNGQRQELPSKSEPSVVQIQVQVPDYAEEIEFEMGEQQNQSQSFNDSEPKPMDDYDSSSTSSSGCTGCSNNSENLDFNLPGPLGLDEYTVDMLYNQMYKMFPRLYDWDQLMAKEQD